MAGRTPALQQNWQSSEKSQNVKEKTQYLMNTQYMGHPIFKNKEIEELTLNIRRKFSEHVPRQ